MSSFAFCEECWWWLKAKLTSVEQVESERELQHFDRGTKPELLQGTVFQWQQQPLQPESSSNPAGAATVVFSSALSSLTKLAVNSNLLSQTVLPTKSIPVMVRLNLPAKGTPAQAGMLTRISNYVMQDDSNSTSLVWTSLELDKNQPKYAGRLALHRAQQVKEKEGVLTILDHENKVLFQGKADEASRWAGMIKEAMKVLAPQIEDEAVGSRGVTYRAQQLERLEARKKEREEEKKKLGQVTMAHTARAMMAAENA